MGLTALPDDLWLHYLSDNGSSLRQTCRMGRRLFRYVLFLETRQWSRCIVAHRAVCRCTRQHMTMYLDKMIVLNFFFADNLWGQSQQLYDISAFTENCQNSIYLSCSFPVFEERIVLNGFDMASLQGSSRVTPQHIELVMKFFGVFFEAGGRLSAGC